ncbi:unnamed protein product [Rhizophagus irregularis]|uniref:Uncharacterized protein n=1 Tax=Rhizophagus irregularis TaxID=588596 RepID=A0A915ZLP1_9GLOM|nr:unnamed protein product [Rhizophagus irregularis]CAB5379911.1 unnamed protein product [Rhizophagus irregularis]
MTSPSRKRNRTIYFHRKMHRQQQGQQSEQSHNLDEALANIINNMHISNQDNNFVPREWYEKLWKDFQILERDYDSLNIRFKFGLGLWRLVLIFTLLYFLIIFINKWL